MLRLTLMTAVSAFALSACNPASDEATLSSETPVESASDTTSTEQNEAERLYAWLDEVYLAELEYDPESKTSLGMIDDDYSRWSDPSEEAEIAAHEREIAYLEQLRNEFDLEALDEDAALAYRFAEFEWDLSIRRFPLRKNGYAFSPMLDELASLTTFLVNEHRIDSVDHAQAYISRLQSIDTQIDALVTDAEERASLGVQLPLFAYPRLINSANRLLSGAPFEDSAEDGVLLDDLTAKVEALELPEEEASALINAGEAALRDVYMPAVQRYIASLERLELTADDRHGIWKSPDGEAYYASQLEFFTTRDDLTADEIHQIGLDEVDRIHGEMRAIMDEVGFEGDLQDFFVFTRTDEQFLLPQSEEGRQQYLDMSTEYINELMVVAPDFFDTLPEAELEVRAVESWREGTSSGAFYSRPALDGSRPGYYYVNLSKMDENPIYLMESLAYHEGAPGHHFQIALAQELENVPWLQKTAWYSAFGEGWALYAENLGKDMGFFTDPYMDFGRLSYEIFRAARLVVDTGIHSKQWTREEAIEYMVTNTPLPEGDIINEVERYIVWPGQAVSYKIGMNTILESRQEAMDALGDDFDWGGFHDAVLTAGTIPLPLMQDRVREWIVTVQTSE